MLGSGWWCWHEAVEVYVCWLGCSGVAGRGGTDVVRLVRWP